MQDVSHCEKVTERGIFYTRPVPTFDIPVINLHGYYEDCLLHPAVPMQHSSHGAG